MSSLSDVEVKANDVDETMVGVNMTSLLPFVVEKQSEQEKKLVNQIFYSDRFLVRTGMSVTI